VMSPQFPLLPEVTVSATCSFPSSTSDHCVRSLRFFFSSSNRFCATDYTLRFRRGRPFVSSSFSFHSASITASLHFIFVASTRLRTFHLA
jgi:hypothetical protein